jgi:hypothetical protein
MKALCRLLFSGSKMSTAKEREHHMRSGLVLTMVFVAGGIGLGAPGDAIAGLAP